MITGYFNVVALQAAEKTASCNISRYSYFNFKDCVRNIKAQTTALNRAIT